MKKFFVGLLSVFLIFGASILSACGSDKVELSLSASVVEVKVQEEGSTEDNSTLVYATVKGDKDAVVTAQTTTENGKIIKVSTYKGSKGRTVIKIVGIKEGQADVIVSVGSETRKTIAVEVYSEVESMTPKIEETQFKENFAIRNDTITLVDSKLFSFKPSENSRRKITWSLVDETSYASIVDNKLTIKQEYEGNTITVAATTEKNITGQIVLPVIDKIEESLELSWSNTRGGEYEIVNKNNNIFNIVPNIPSDENYETYVKINYIGDLGITPYVLLDGKPTQAIQVIRQTPDAETTFPIFKVYANKDNQNIDGQFVLYFTIGYQNYNYSISTKDNPINIVARQKVNNIQIRNENNQLITDSKKADEENTAVQTLYTEYSGKIGPVYNLDILPHVSSFTNKYFITISCGPTGVPTQSKISPIEIFYRDEYQNEVPVFLKQETTGEGDVVFKTHQPILAKQLYMRASSDLSVQSTVDEIHVIFTSVDNDQVSTTLKTKLVKSVSANDFNFKDADFVVDSSIKAGQETVITKTFTLKGQTATDGLGIENLSDNVEITQPTFISSTEDSVTFSIRLTLKKESYGITQTDKYRIYHENGLSKEYKINIFLPLTDAGVIYDSGKDNASNAVTNFQNSDKAYAKDGTDFKNNSSLSRIMIKNHSAVPVYYSFNESMNHFAKAEIKVNYLDYIPGGEETVEDFKGLIINDVFKIIQQASVNDLPSQVANLTANNSVIKTASAGFTYALFTFKGKNEANVDFEIYRIVLIESYDAPSGLSVVPDNDKNIVLYSADTVSSSDLTLTTKKITIDFGNSEITYKNVKNFKFVSSNEGVMGQSRLVGDNAIVWENGRYSIQAISIGEGAMTFVIHSASIGGMAGFRDSLSIHYILDIETDNGVIKHDVMSTVINIHIKNAERVEEVKWMNSNENGIYFEVSEKNQSAYLIMKTSSRDEAKNKTLTYLVTEQTENGQVARNIVDVKNQANTQNIGINLNQGINKGTNGFIYILPQDAIYNGSIKYYYKNNDKEYIDSVKVEDLGTEKTPGVTWYDYLIEHAEFKSSSKQGIVKNFSFKNILIRINIYVADGRDFDHAYRIYNNTDFENIKPNLFYTLMNDIEIHIAQNDEEGFKSLDNFSGGLQGKSISDPVSITYLNNVVAGESGDVVVPSSNFANVLTGTIRNLTFMGNVGGNAEGFVANINQNEINNVTIDVMGRYSSKLVNETATAIGGIVGTNDVNGKILDSSVLGVTIKGKATTEESFVGGIAGENRGVIDRTKVEIYNCLVGEDPAGDELFEISYFEGNVVAGLVGNAVLSSKITNSFIYDYTLLNNNVEGQAFRGNFPAAAIGKLNPSISESGKILASVTKSFAVTNQEAFFGEVVIGEVDTLDPQDFDYYTGYYDVNDTYQVKYSNPSSTFLVSEGSEFRSYVNLGKPHYKDVYQEEKISSVSEKIVTYKDKNGYYKSLETADSHKGIIFFYGIKGNVSDLDPSEEQDLKDLNTISLANLVGNENVSRNIVITSSNDKILKVSGLSITAVKEGDVLIILSSKQNAAMKKVISVKVMKALSNITISYINEYSGDRVTVSENSAATLQKTKTRNYVIANAKDEIILGNNASIFKLYNSDVQYKFETKIADGVPAPETAVEHVMVNATLDKDILAINVPANSVQKDVTNKAVDTDIKVYLNIDGLSKTYADAIKNEFDMNFTIKPVDGRIFIETDNKELPLTASTNTSVKVHIVTTAANDKETLYPMIKLDGEMLPFERDNNSFTYKLPESYSNNKNILVAVVDLIEEKDTNPHEYVFNVNFSVDSEFVSYLDRDYDFSVTFASPSQIDSYNESLDDGKISLHLSRQNINNIDVVNYFITRSYYAKVDNEYQVVHTLGEETTVLAPGNSSILKFNVNPGFAYYNCFELSYSGIDVLDAINFEILSEIQVKNSQNKSFIANKSAKVEFIANKILYYPTVEERNLGVLYFKVWLNTTVNANNTIKFKARFIDKIDETGEMQVLSEVNNYVLINYLSKPSVNINGEETAFIARGETAEIKVNVFEDQVVDRIAIKGETQFISISNISEPVVDPVTRIKTYSATIFAQVKATAAYDTFQITASVSRVINGVAETKVSYATAILVDFKVDTDNINVSNAVDDKLTVWLNVAKPINVEYSTLPGQYTYDHNDQDSVEAVKSLEEAKSKFESTGYYPEQITPTTDFKYAINYKYNDLTKQYEVQTLKDRLFYVNDNQYIPITDEVYAKTQNIKFNYDEQGTDVSISGNKISGSTPVKIALLTYVYFNGYVSDYIKIFDVYVEAYSDPDIPLTISSSEEFLNLNPALNISKDPDQQVKKNDYILTQDIVLEKYVPFSTDLIRSLDGNGYTIFIKSFDQSLVEGKLNFSLFTTVKKETFLKNMRVNLYNGGQISINVESIKEKLEINIAGFAVNNEGVITNSEVVAFYTSKQVVDGKTNKTVSACEFVSDIVPGIHVKFIKGSGTDEEIFLEVNSKCMPTVSGFVINNNGSITNSRVGGSAIVVLENEKIINNQPIGVTVANEVKLPIFSIYGQGDVAGFVSKNYGSIAASYVKRVDIENVSNVDKYDTAGFVNISSPAGKITGSYVEGEQTPPEKVNLDGYSAYAFEGTSIRSRLGVIAGFINLNNGKIKDCYSNILIANSDASTKVFLASGFVYKNVGVIETSFSASQISDSRYNQMNFSGVDKEGNILLQGQGRYINCYFFNKLYENSEDNIDSTTESQFGTGALLVSHPTNASYYYGFSIANGEQDGIWRISEDTGITLIEANHIAYSHRYVQYVDTDSYEGAVGENAEGKYILLYSMLQLNNVSRTINTALGSEDNPIVIKNANDFVEVMGSSVSSNIKQNYNKESIWGNYRVVQDIKFAELSTDKLKTLPSTSKSFNGRLFGNGFTISGISITSDNSFMSYGLFSAIEPRKGITPIVTNLNLDIEQVVAGNVPMVGGLAGYIKDSYILNITINMVKNPKINGANFVGGLTGVAFANNIIKNIVVNDPYVQTNKYDKTVAENITYDKLIDIRNILVNSLTIKTSINSSLVSGLLKYSFAGAVAGYVDNFMSEQDKFIINQSQNYSINNVRVNGQIYIQAENAGGVFGLTGFQTHLSDVGIKIKGGIADNKSHIISTKLYAGGVVGLSFGHLDRVFAQYDELTTMNIENNMGSFYSKNDASDIERGAIDLFYLKNTDYTQKAVGGIVGYVGSGLISTSYSKLNVTVPSADFAGGIIGYMYFTEEVDEYNAEEAKTTDALPPGGVYTKYFINEVYATGDVRAKTLPDIDKAKANAGGIIGAICGDSPKVAFAAVNAVNYFTLYDYSKGAFHKLDNSYTNLSNIMQLNVLVGSTYNETTGDGGITIHNYLQLDWNNYESYIKLVRSMVSGDAQSHQTLYPMTFVYESYSFAKRLFRFNLFGGSEFEINADPNKQVLVKEFNLGILKDPSYYSNSVVGRTYTSQGFINSGIWSEMNWSHPLENLFPEIKYQRISDVIYLDYYNAIDILKNASNTASTIIVRGKKDRDDVGENPVLIDIDLDALIEAEGIDPSNIVVANFAGKLIGSGLYKNSDPESPNVGDRIKIISSFNFIQSAAPGAQFSNIIVEYRNTTQDSITIEADGINGGLFVKEEINEARINDLTIILDGPVNVSVKNDANYSFGIVASKIISSMLNNINIICKTGLTSTTHIVNIHHKKGEVGTLNVGVIAGELSQVSTVSEMIVSNINISSGSSETEYIPVTPAKLIMAKFTDSDEADIDTKANINIGGYFGYVNKIKEDSEARNALDLKIDIKSITRNANNADYGEYQGLSVYGYKGEINIGGYLGYVSGLNSITTFKEKPVRTNFEFDISANSDSAIDVESANTNIDSINAGVLIGKLAQQPLGSINMNSSNFALNFIERKNAYANTANIGGIVGYSDQNLGFSLIQGAELRIANAPFNIVDQAKLNVNKFDIEHGKTTDSQSNEKYFAKIKYANIGGIAGLAHGKFSCDCENLIINKNIQENNAEESSIRVKSNDGAVNIGSVLGSAGYNQNGNTSFNGNFDILTIEKPFKSAMTHLIEGDSTFNIGGVVGNINGTSGTENATKILINGLQNKIKFEGSTFSNVKTLNFGGAIGNVNDAIIEAKNIAYSGAVKIYGSSTAGENYSNEANIVTGGILGNVSSCDLMLIKNYTYGDVFVEYNEDLKLDKLTSYHYGGIIGFADATTSDNSANAVDNIKDNHTIMTSHNARKVSEDIATFTENALFGSTIKASQNYYNHSVTLCTDPLGIDIGYNNPYQDLKLNLNKQFRQGYYETEDGSELGIEPDILSQFDEGLQINSTKNRGHKLNPLPVQSNGKLSVDINTPKCNGIVYFTLSNYDIFNTQISISDIPDIAAQTSVAIIGNGALIKTYDEDLDIYMNNAFISELSNYSTLSSFVIDSVINIKDQNNETAASVISAKTAAEQTKYALAVLDMNKNSQIYALQVKGKIEVHNTLQLDVAGVVANMQSGRLKDVSADIDITYASAPLGNVAGIALTHEVADYTPLNQYIENTYVTGRLKTMIDAKVYAFANGSKNTSISNSYTTTKVDWNDFTLNWDAASNDTIGKSLNQATCISVFGGVSKEYTTNVFFDKNALNTYFSETEIKAHESYVSDMNGLIKIDPPSATQAATMTTATTANEKLCLEGNYEKSDIKYNYGYPTLKYGFMKTSSFVQCVKYTNDLGEETDESMLSSRFSKKKGEDVKFDHFVEKATYTKFVNNTKFTPEGEGVQARYNYYMMIPTYAHMIKMDKMTEYAGGIVDRFVLINDIDKKYLTDTEISMTFTKGIFDGQEHTIKNLKSPLFAKIGNKSDDSRDYLQAVVKNLRVTDCVITNSSLNKVGVLANEVKYSTITNITVSGEISGDKVLGGAIGESDNACLANITSIVNLSLKGAGTAGGIVGNITSEGEQEVTVILFCSNYGNIMAQASPSEKTMLPIGGLVGKGLHLYDIRYSYNVGSLTNGYKEEKGIFAAGGIVGHSCDSKIVAGLNTGIDRYPSIYRSYNSGIITVGNRENTGGRSYAGGIVGCFGSTLYSQNSEPNIKDSISYCFNEAHVEAIGPLPKYNFQWKDQKLYRGQSVERNVWAYSITYAEVDSTNQQVALGDMQIHSNGSLGAKTAFKDKTMVFDFETYKKTGGLKLTYGINGKSEIWSTDDPVVNKFNNTSFAAGADMYVRYYSEVSMDYIEQPDVDHVTNLDVNATENCEVTTDIHNIPININIPISYKITSSIKNGGGASDWFFYVADNNSRDAWNSGKYTASYTTSKSYDQQLDLMKTTQPGRNSNDLYWKEIQQYYSGSSVNNSSLSTSISTAEIQAQCRSHESIHVNNKTTINGQEYYLGNSHNIENVLQAGISKYVSEIKTDKLPFVSKKFYTINAVNTNDDAVKYDCAIDKVSWINNEVVINYAIYSTEPIKDANIKVSVTCNYSKSIDFDLSSTQIFYESEYSVGIKIPHMLMDKLEHVEDVTLSYKTESYDNIVQFSQTPEFNDKYYLHYDVDKNLYIFVPNATLSKDDMEGIVVNNIDKYTSVKENYTEVINFLAGKNFWVKQEVPGGEVEEILSFHYNIVEKNDIKQEYNVTIPGKDIVNHKHNQEISRDLNYGNQSNLSDHVIQGSVNPEDDILFFDVDETGLLYNGDYEYIFKSEYIKDFIIKFNNEAVVQRVAGTWKLIGTQDNTITKQIDIDGTTYDVIFSVINSQLSMKYSLKKKISVEQLAHIDTIIKDLLKGNVDGSDGTLDAVAGIKGTPHLYYDVTSSYKVTLLASDIKTIGKDMILEYMSNIFLAYQYSGNDVTPCLAPGQQVTVNGVVFSLAVSGKNIVFEYVGQEIEKAKDFVSSMTQGIKVYVNDFSDKLEQVSVTTGQSDWYATNVFLSDNSDAHKVQVNYSGMRSYSDLNKNISIIVDEAGETFQLKFSDNREGLNAITYAGVTIYKGVITKDAMSFKVSPKTIRLAVDVKLRNDPKHDFADVFEIEVTYQNKEIISSYVKRNEGESAQSSINNMDYNFSKTSDIHVLIKHNMFYRLTQKDKNQYYVSLTSSKFSDLVGTDAENNTPMFMEGHIINKQEIQKNGETTTTINKKKTEISAVRFNDDHTGVNKLGRADVEIEYSYHFRDQDGKLVSDKEVNQETIEASIFQHEIKVVKYTYTHNNSFVITYYEYYDNENRMPIDSYYSITSYKGISDKLMKDNERLTTIVNTSDSNDMMYVIFAAQESKIYKIGRNFANKFEKVEIEYDSTTKTITDEGKTYKFIESDGRHEGWITKELRGTSKVNDIDISYITKLMPTISDLTQRDIYIVNSRSKYFYLTIDSDYSVIQNAITLLGADGKPDSETPKPTTITQTQFDVNKDDPVPFPQYNLYESDMDINLSKDYNLLKIENNFDNYTENCIIKYDENKTKVQLIMHNSSLENVELTLGVKADNQIHEISLSGISANDPSRPMPILLTQDIILNKIQQAVILKSGIQLIGNGYYLSFVGTLYKEVESDFYMKDITLLGTINCEEYAATKNIPNYLFGTVETGKKVILDNINMYGAVINYRTKNNFVFGEFKKVYVKNPQDEAKLYSNVSVENRYQTDTDSVVMKVSLFSFGEILNDSKKINIQSNAVIYTATGEHFTDIFESGDITKDVNGQMGEKDINKQKGTKAKKGRSGVDLEITSVVNSVHFDNNSAIFIGSGSNGGAAGNNWYVKGTDGNLSVNSTLSTYNPVYKANEPYESGKAGKAGSCIGDISSIGGNKIITSYFTSVDGKPGKQGRNPYGRFYYKNYKLELDSSNAKYMPSDSESNATIFAYFLDDSNKVKKDYKVYIHLSGELYEDGFPSRFNKAMQSYWKALIDEVFSASFT